MIVLWKDESLRKTRLGFVWSDISTQQRAATQGEFGLEAPSLGDGGGVEVFREDEFAGSTHQRVGRGRRLGGRQSQTIT